MYEYGIKVAGVEPGRTVVQPSLHHCRPGPSDEIIYGDLNNDGRVDSTDLIYMKRLLLKIMNTLPNMEGADVNRDGNIDATDLTILKRYILRRLDSLPV